MNLLFTGASGFLGRNIKPLLEETYFVKTIGLTTSDDFQINIAKEIPSLNMKFDVILHAAGKAHVVPKNKNEEQAFYDVNYQGTVNICMALENFGIPKAFIFISTVAVYGCDFGQKITEEHTLDGTTPYAKSKIMAEQYLMKWCSKHNVLLSIIRPSLIAGPNPPGNLGAMIAGIKSGKYLSISGGKARKSVLMVQDIAHLVPLLVNKGGIYNVCDDSQPTFRELESIICRDLGKRLPLSVPYSVAKLLALLGDSLGNKAPIDSLRLNKITESLTFSNEKVKKELGWKPLSVLESFTIK